MSMKQTHNYKGMPNLIAIDARFTSGCEIWPASWEHDSKMQNEKQTLAM